MRADIERARQFRSWCEGDEGLFRIFDAIEKSYLGELIASDICDHPLREKVYHRVNALRDVRKVLEAGITEGRSAQSIIEQAAKLAAKKQQRVKA